MKPSTVNTTERVAWRESVAADKPKTLSPRVMADLNAMLANIRANQPADVDEELRETFMEAVEHMSRTKADLSEDTQRRLFGLFHRAQSSSTEKMEAEQKAAIAAESQLTREQAMRAYIELIEVSDSSFLFEDDEDRPGAPAEKPLSELPSMLMDQLKAAGIKEVSVGEAVAAELDVFGAARAGAPLGAHLPDGAFAADEAGLTALHHAVDAEQAGAAQALLAAKADPNALDADGSTPLHYAVTVGSAALVKLLLSFGADPLLPDEDGNDAAKLAKAQGHAELEAVLAAGPSSSSSSSSPRASTGSTTSSSAAASQ